MSTSGSFRFWGMAGLAVILMGIAATLVACKPANGRQETTLRNVSYDPTRELYDAINPAFARHYKETAGEDVKVLMYHGGSGKQARAVIDGAKADVVTLALAGDIDSIAEKSGLLPAEWQTKLPSNSAPYTSTIVFVVRKGNPKGIKDWEDLIKPGVEVITPDPKSSGGARWAYLAAWGQALKANGNDEGKARGYVAELYKHVPVLDSGARASTVTFGKRQQGDVLLSWENEAYLAVQEFGEAQLEIVTPAVSILAEPSVAVLEKATEKNGTTKAAKAYLEFLYTPEAQGIIAKNHYRPRDAEAAKKSGVEFAQVELFTINDVFGGWAKAQSVHFADKGVFDQFMTEAKK